MSDCLLCKKKHADKTGSHIIPHFLTKRIDNVNGSNERHKEVSFVVGEKGESFYVGNAVLPEQYEEVLGQLSDEEIEKMKNPSVHDNLFCKVCEDRFGAIESEYSNSIGAYDNSRVYKSKNEGGLAFLFWTSLIWRLSISPSHNLKLSEEEEERLRKLLDQYLHLKLVEIDLSNLYKNEAAQSLGYQLIRSINYSETHATVLIFDPANNNPYSIMVDEFIFYFYFNTKQQPEAAFKFFGFESNIKEAPLNSIRSAENILSISEEEFEAGIKNVAGRAAIQRLQFYDSLFDHLHVTMGGKGNKMPQMIKANIITRVVNSEKEIGRKYGVEELTKVIFEEMQKFAS